jgi:hypothetical protein
VEDERRLLINNNDNSVAVTNETTHQLSTRSTTFIYDEIEYEVTYFSHPTSSTSAATSSMSSIRRQLSSVLDPSRDFKTQSHALERWFGLDEYLVVSPVSATHDVSMSECAQLLSTFAIAAKHVSSISSPSSVPTFVSLHAKWMLIFRGHFLCDQQTRFRLESDLLPSVPPSFMEFSGMLDYFEAQSKSMAMPTARSNEDLSLVSFADSVSVSARFTFMLRDFFEEDEDSDVDAAEEEPVTEHSKQQQQQQKRKHQQDLHPSLTQLNRLMPDGLRYMLSLERASKRCIDGM